MEEVAEPRALAFILIGIVIFLVQVKTLMTNQLFVIISQSSVFIDPMITVVNNF